MVKNHFAYGYLFENLIISEIIKTQKHLGKNLSIYYWRESNGTEIDCIIDKGNNRLIAIEIKAGETFNSSFLRNLKKVKNSGNIQIDKKLIYTGELNTTISDMEIITWNSFGNFIRKL